MTSLLELPVLLVDVQATGANPQKGAHPIDLAWCPTHALDPAPDPSGSLIALPEGAYLPRRVSKLTGVTAAQLSDAPHHDDVAALLSGAWGSLPPERALVAHYARYERPFVASWLGQDAADAMICTHEIVKRLMPNLPRRGLRPIAGYFGARLSDHKSARVHVDATAVIWREVALILAQEEDVHTLDDLRTWLATRSGKRTGKRAFPLPREVRLGLPETPGVYRMLNRRGEVLYVGKATSLKSRVNSYFRGKHGEGERKLELVSAVVALDVTPLPTPLEAALLETDEIKRHAPFYNVALREEDRAIWFASPHDLLDLSTEHAPHRTVGPLASPDLAIVLGTLTRALSGEAELDPEWFYGLPEQLEDGALPEDPLAPGLTLFRDWHGVGADATTQDLLALGLALHEAHLAERERIAAEAAEAELGPELLAEIEEAEDDEDDGQILPDWTPERVAGKLTRLVRGGARRIRRGALLTQLANASLVWSPPRGGDPRHVRLEGGAVASQGPAHELSAPSSPPADPLPLFDVPTYDRVSVLSAELKRLAREAADVTLHLPGHPTPIDLDALRALMRLV